MIDQTLFTDGGLGQQEDGRLPLRNHTYFQTAGLAPSWLESTPNTLDLQNGPSWRQRGGFPSENS